MRKETPCSYVVERVDAQGSVVLEMEAEQSVAGSMWAQKVDRPCPNPSTLCSTSENEKTQTVKI